MFKPIKKGGKILQLCGTFQNSLMNFTHTYNKDHTIVISVLIQWAYLFIVPPVNCQTFSKLHPRFSQMLHRTAIAVQFSWDECYIDAVFWTSSWRRSSCHSRWEHTTTKVYIFVLFVEFFVEHGDHTTFYKLRQISLGLTDQWMSNKSCYIFHSDWLPRQ